MSPTVHGFTKRFYLMHHNLVECDSVLPADGDFVFMLNLHAESANLLLKCLTMLRAAYPESPVCVILDGDPVAPINAIMGACYVQNAVLLPGLRLKKGLSNGAAIWTRLLMHALRFNTDYVVKLDPDTRIHKRLTYVPSLITNGVAGRIMSPDNPARHVQGGFQIMPRLFAEYALAESMREEYKDPAFWASGQSDVFTSRNLISTDYTLSAIMRNLSSVFIPHPEIECRSVRGEQPFSRASAVTHPHKDPTE